MSPSGCQSTAAGGDERDNENWKLGEGGGGAVCGDRWGDLRGHQSVGTALVHVATVSTDADATTLELLQRHEGVTAAAGGRLKTFEPR
jgi:hypothetical protein